MILFLGFNFVASGQQELEEDSIHTVIQIPPMFPGGEEARIEYLSNNLEYPEEAKEANIQGKVYAQFIVMRDGSIKSVRVLRGIGGGCDEEAARVIREMPNWIPGTQNGQNDSLLRVEIWRDSKYVGNSEVDPH